MGNKVVVGMSGGVDSTAAAFLLQRAGYEVIGVTLRTWAGETNRCCEIDTAQAAAQKLGIAYHVLNCVPDFQKNVVKPFVESYLRGFTPNPCVICNPEVKWTHLFQAAELMGADRVSTGHYATLSRLDNGRYTIGRAADVQKDQSYMLYRLTQEQLSRTLFPLGNLTKAEIRRVAEWTELPGADTPDSQELCFVTEGTYTDYIERFSEHPVPGEGNFVDEQGNILGRHKGIIHYTVGQRKGLGLSLGHPVYVKSIRAQTNEVVIGDDSSLYGRDILCGELCFMSIADIAPGEHIRAKVKIRYRHRERPATLEKHSSGTVLIHFDEPVRAAAPGQSAVFYDSEGHVMGGGMILKAYTD